MYSSIVDQTNAAADAAQAAHDAIYDAHRIDWSQSEPVCRCGFEPRQGARRGVRAQALGRHIAHQHRLADAAWFATYDATLAELRRTGGAA